MWTWIVTCILLVQMWGQVSQELENKASGWTEGWHVSGGGRWNVNAWAEHHNERWALASVLHGHELGACSTRRSAGPFCWFPSVFSNLSYLLPNLNAVLVLRLPGWFANFETYWYVSTFTLLPSHPCAHYYVPYTVPASGNEISDKEECPYKIPFSLIKHCCILGSSCIGGMGNVRIEKN